jgi:prepilin signal peptidase PulO-like enzyme (type II secretory pathway)
MTSSFAYTTFFVLGLAVGSFLNVIAMRYNSGGKLLAASLVSGRSKCPGCNKALRWFELFPVISFVFLRGKCRECKAKLSFQYPVIEILTGLVFLFVPVKLKEIFHLWGAVSSGQNFFLLALMALWLLVFSLLILVFLIDLRLFIIPDHINLLLAVLGIFAIFIGSYWDLFGSVKGSFLGHHSLLFGFRDSIWLNHIAGALIGLIVFGLIAVLSRGRAMGWGDVKLMGALGLIFGWPDVLIIMFLAFVIGAIVSLFILALGKKSLKDIVPFGPFIALGAGIVFFFGIEIMTGYFNLFNFF